MPPLRQQKKHKKWLNLYRQYYGIHKPYTVLVEPIFLKEARRRKLAIKDHLQRVFLQTAFPVITKCTQTYLRDQGTKEPEWEEAKEAARRIQIVECSHKYGEEKKPIECIKSVVESPPAFGHTTSKFVVASEDTPLKTWCRQREGQPLLFIDTSRFALDKPSKATKAKAKQVDAVKLHLTTNVPLPPASPPSPPPPAPFVKLHRRAKGPNPLSIRKRRRAGEGDANDAEDNTNGSGADVRKRTSTRRGTRAGKSIKAKKLQNSASQEVPIVGVQLVE